MGTDSPQNGGVKENVEGLTRGMERTALGMEGRQTPGMERAAPGEGRSRDPRHGGGSTRGWRTDRPPAWRGQHRGEMEGGPWDGADPQVRARRVGG